MLRLLPLVSQLASAAAPSLQGCAALSNSAYRLLSPASNTQDHRLASGSQCSSSQGPTSLHTPLTWSRRLFGSLVQLHAPEYALGLHNLRDNPGALKKRIRVGRGDGSRRGNYAGRGMKGLKARGRSHILYDGGQLGLLKFPVTRERPPYEVLYNQLSINRLIEYVQLGLLDHTQLITMKDLQDSGCVKDIKYGVLLYGKGHGSLGFPMHIQVTACDPEVKAQVERAGGSVTRVYYTAEGLRALLNPEKIVRYNLPRPRPPVGWHPKHNGKFDSVGQLPFHIETGQVCELVFTSPTKTASATSSTAA